MNKMICTLDYQTKFYPVNFTFKKGDKIQKSVASNHLYQTLKRKNMLLPGGKFVVEIYADNYKVRPFDIGKDGDLSELERYLNVIEQFKSELTLEEYKLMKKEALEDINRIKENTCKS